LDLADAVHMLTKSTGSTGSFKTHGKYKANLITFNGDLFQ
jgi:hypothetical protein